MQQDADFITEDFLYMFRASCAHHQEYKILTRQPPVQVVMVACATCNHNCITSVFYLTLTWVTGHKQMAVGFAQHKPLSRSRFQVSADK